MICDEDDRAGLWHGSERMGVVSDIELERAHRGLPERLAQARKALVMHIHALELRLAGRFFNQTYQPPLDRRIARGRVAEEILVHLTRLHGPAGLTISITRPSCDKLSSSALGCALGETVEILQLGDQRLEILQWHHVGAIRWRVIGVLMGLDEDASDANRHGRPRQHLDERALPARRGPLPARLLHRMGS